MRADLQSKQSQLQVQIAIVKSQYEALTPNQREALAAMPPPRPHRRPPPPPGQDPAVLAAPPAARPAAGVSPVRSRPGDIAPPGSPASHHGDPGRAEPHRLAVLVGRVRARAPSTAPGLVMWSFQQAGISLPHSSQALARAGSRSRRDQMQPGDLVTYYSDASHVGIYIGDGMMVHASTYGTPVRVAPVDNAPIYNVRRY